MLNVHINHFNSHIVLEIEGTLDISTISVFEEHTSKFERMSILTVDFTKLEFIDSTGIGAILELVYVTKEKGASIRLEGLHDNIKDIFDTVGVLRVIEALRREDI
jgi:anti-anti-sigma factor